ncbi:MAG: DUF1800 family protein [Cocleimonas sp.]|nr:DUF1800 family protein [Cocleimonas sp.]
MGYSLKHITLHLLIIVLGLVFILGSDPEKQPSITILGKNPISIEQGSVYNDAGATAKDEKGVTIAVITTGLAALNTATIGDYLLTYTATDINGSIATKKRTITVVKAAIIDTTRPVITLLGHTTVSITKGSTYTDAGATAVDDREGDLTAKIVMSHTVDTQTIGTYTVTYQVTDGANNAATQVTRSVIVISVPDSIRPVITLLGDTMVNITEGSTYIDAGATATDHQAGNLTVTTTGIVDTAKVGTYILTYHAKDNADNKADAKTRTIHVIPKINRVDALRFLGQAALVRNESDITFIEENGYEKWFDMQAAQPYLPNLHLKRTIRFAKKVAPNNHPATEAMYLADNGTVFNQSAEFNMKRYQMSAWFEIALLEKDQLRHKMAYALSQIIVESLAQSLFIRRTEALSTYFDTLTKHALGNYRDLLLEISHSASMGLYLTYNGSQKEHTVNSAIISPDENYARELMQLFTIGLQALNIDGTPKLDHTNNPIPTYTQTDVNELARVFTGWDLKGSPRFGRISNKTGDLTQPLAFTAEFHDANAKTVLGTHIPAGNTGSQDIEAVITLLMGHDNIAPFIAKQLIMRLTKSNPSSAYVERVARIFNDNGQGIKGDLKAVAKAILLDPEVINNHDIKKYKEPLLAYTQFLNAFNVQPFPSWKLKGSDETLINTLLMNDPTKYLGQAPARAFTVFNFYSNTYTPSTALFRDKNLVAPELQIQSDSMLINFNNEVSKNLLSFEKRYLIKSKGSITVPTQNIGVNRFLLDCSAEYNVLEKALEGHVDGSFSSFNRVKRENDPTDEQGSTARDRALNALILHLNNKLTGGKLTSEQQSILFNGYKDVFYGWKISRDTDPEARIFSTIIVPLITAIISSETYLSE